MTAGLLAGMAAWLSCGAVAVTASDGTRIGILPSPGWAALIAAGVGIWTWLRPVIGRTTPLLLLVVLPWVPLGPKAMLTWSGPLAHAVWIAWIIAAAIRSGLTLPASWRAGLLVPSRAMGVAFAVALIGYAGGLWSASKTVPGGDEPHYLIIAQSLLSDGDLRIENNHRQLDHLAYFAGEMKPDYLRRAVDGDIYSIHAPGLPLVVAPALGLLGHRGAAIFLALLCAAGSALAWRVAFDVSGDALAAWVGWAAVALTAPFAAHAFTIYPDGLASILMIVSVLALTRAGRLAAAVAPPAAVSWLLYGAAPAMLPWLHTRYALLSAGIGLAVILRLTRAGQHRAVLVFLAMPFVSACGWFGFFLAVYGTLNPSAPYGGYTQAAWAHILPGVTGLLVDQQYGLLATAPVLAWAAAGFATMLRQPTPGRGTRRLSIELLAIMAIYTCACAAYRMWWGGFSGPARFLVPIVLPLAVPIAVAWTRITAPAFRALVTWTLLWSVGFAVVLLSVDGGAFGYTTRAAAAPWTSWMSPVVDLGRGLPGMFRGSLAVTIGQAGAWILALGCAGVTLWALARRHRLSFLSSFTEWAAPVLGVAVMAALTIGWGIDGGPPLRPTSPLHLLRRAADVAPRVGLLQAGIAPGWTLDTPSAVLSTVRLRSDDAATRGRDAVLLSLGALPPGRFRIHAKPDPQQSAVLTVHVGRAASPVRSLDLGIQPRDGSDDVALDLVLPVRIETLSVRQQRGAPVVGTWLQPLSVEPQPTGVTGEASLAADYGTAVAYFMSDGVFPEPAGFWVTPGLDVVVVLQPTNPAVPLSVRLRNAPVPNRIVVGGGGEKRAWDVQPGEERTMPLALSGAGRSTVLRLRADRGVRPVERDPSNRDMRLLGVWVEIFRTSRRP